MNNQLSNLLIMLGMMIIARFLDFENKLILNSVRLVYFTSILSSLLILQLTKWRIEKANNLTVLKYVSKDSNSFFDMASNYELESSAESSGSSERLHVITIKDYDLTEINSALKSLFNNLLIMLFMHFYFGYTNPLFMQSISPIKSTLENKVVKIMFFNHSDTGYLKRPFRAEPMFGNDMSKNKNSMMNMISGGYIKTDKKTIVAFEKAGNGGIMSD